LVASATKYHVVLKAPGKNLTQATIWTIEAITIEALAYFRFVWSSVANTRTGIARTRAGKNQ
jgi:hypothetical protein